MLAAGTLDLPTLITDIRQFADIEAVFASLDGNPTAMKTLVQVGQAQ